MQTHKLLVNLNSKVREETLEGKKYLVASAAIMEEGVWEGSAGAGYYSKKEVSKTPAVWNHKPLVMHHPTMNGKGISACDPVILESRKCGLMLNTLHDNKLRTEAWFDIEKTEKLQKELKIDVLGNLKQGVPIEVSTGLFCDVEPMPGTFNGKDYDFVVSNIRPDHLAILPDKEGAYSIKDGGGLLANERRVLTKEEYLTLQEESNKRYTDELIAVNVLNADGNGSVLVMNKISHQDVNKGLTQAMLTEYSKENSNYDYWPGYIEDIYDDFYIYSQNGMYYKRGYSVDANYNVNPFGKADQVKQHQEWRSMDNDHVATKNRDMSGSKVSKSMPSVTTGDKGTPEPTKAEPSKGGHRHELPGSKSASGNQGSKGMGAKSVSKVSTSPARSMSFNEGVGNMADGQQQDNVAVTNASSNPDPAKKLSDEELLNNASPRMRNMLKHGLAAYDVEKKRLVDVILGNKRNTFTKEVLEAKDDLDELRAIASLATDPTPVNNSIPKGFGNFFGAAGTPPITNGTPPTKQEALTIPVMNFSRGDRKTKKLTAKVADGDDGE